MWNLPRLSLCASVPGILAGLSVHLESSLFLEAFLLGLALLRCVHCHRYISYSLIALHGEALSSYLVCMVFSVSSETSRSALSTGICMSDLRTSPRPVSDLIRKAPRIS